MQRNFDAHLTDLYGNVILDENKNKIPMSAPLVNVLLAEFPEERIDGVEKLKRFKLAEKISKGGPIDLDIDELALLKKLVGKWLNPLLNGKIMPLLESE